MLKKTLICLVVFVVLVPWVLPVYAAGKSVQLEKIVVTTPTRMAQEDHEIGSDVTVLDAEKIASSGANFVADILKEEPGIYYYDNSTVKTAKIDMRGFGDTAHSNTLVMVDGRKINPVDIAGPDLAQIPLEAVERIEIIRGAGSVFYGDNAVGGVINIITKEGKGDFSGSAAAAFGSYNTEEESVEISGTGGRASYYLYSRYFDTDGYRSNSDVLTKDLNTRIGYDLNENTSFDLTANWHEDDYGMPGGLDDISELEQYGRRDSSDEKDFASTKDRHVKLSLDTSPWFDVTDSASFSLDTFYRNQDKYSWFYYGGFPTATKYNIDTIGITTKYAYHGRIGKDDFNFVLGVDYYDTEHGILGSEWSSDDLTITKEETGIYGYSEYEMINNLFATGGMRYQKAEYIFDQKKSSVVYEKKKPSETVFMAGLKYDYAEGSSAHINAHETFRFLATDEWYSTWSGLKTNLRHQKGIQYEAGVRHKINDHITAGITPYIMKLEDEIYVNPYPSPGQNENYDKTERKGAEVMLQADMSGIIKLDFVDGFNVFLNYTYQQARFEGGEYSGNDIPLAPRNMANAGVSAGLFNDYKISVTGKYTGEKYAINDVRNELSKVKGCFVLDARLVYKKHNMEFFAGVNNILDKEYYSYVAKSSSSNKKDYYPAPMRNFEIGARYHF